MSNTKEQVVTMISVSWVFSERSWNRCAISRIPVRYGWSDDTTQAQQLRADLQMLPVGHGRIDLESHLLVGEEESDHATTFSEAVDVADRQHGVHRQFLGDGCQAFALRPCHEDHMAFTQIRS